MALEDERVELLDRDIRDWAVKQQLSEEETIHITEAIFSSWIKFARKNEGGYQTREYVEAWLHYEWPELCPCVGCRVAQKRIRQINEFWNR